jgi:hypothetical protein
MAHFFAAIRLDPVNEWFFREKHVNHCQRLSVTVIGWSLLMGVALPGASAGEPLAKALARPNHTLDQCGGENCAAVRRGLLAFVDRRLKGMGGNGRACVDCHLATDHFQLSPASAQARF